MLSGKDDPIPTIMKWYTDYMKRVRKQSGAPLRYLLAVEEHKDGFPHLHALVHEWGTEVGKRALQGTWLYGHSHVKLADLAAAKYVCKYVTKSPVARLRASLHYGRPDVIASQKREFLTVPPSPLVGGLH